MSLRLLALASLLILPLSGCVGVGSMTADDGLGTATKHAKGLVSGGLDAHLMGVGSIEPFKQYYDADDDVEINTYADSKQGDGKIPAWAYVFCVGPDMVIVFQAAGIGVLADIRDGGECGEEEEYIDFAITDWKVDSDKAAKALNDHPDWPEPIDASMQFWALTMMPYFEEGQDMNDPENFEFSTRPVWFVEYESEETSVFAQVDANTGDVIEVTENPDTYGGDIYFGEVEPAQDCSFGSAYDEGSGIVHALNDVTVTISVDGTGTLDYEFSTDLELADGLTITVVDQDGNEPPLNARGSAGGGIFGATEYVGNYDVVSGTYTVTISSSDLAQVSGTVTAEFEDCN